MKIRSLIMATAMVALASGAHAGSATATFQVSATVNSSCIVSATNIAFGAITPASSGDVTTSGTITSTCTKTTPYTLAISSGSSGSVAARSMAGTSGNTDVLAYNLYQDQGATKVWGDTVGTNTVGLTGTGSAQTSGVFAKLSLNQYIKPDTYTDNLTVTLAY